MRTALILIVTALSIMAGFFLFRSGSTPGKHGNRTGRNNTAMKLEGNRIVRGPTLGTSVRSLPDRGLKNQDGQPVTFRSLTGTPVLMSFIYTSCPDKNMCPRITRKMVETQKRVAAESDLDVHFLSISFDPKTDTPEVLRFYGKQYGVDFDSWSFWTGRPETIEAITDQLNIATKEHPERDTLLHNMRTYVLDENGTIHVAWKGSQWSVDAVVEELRTLSSRPSDGS